MIDFIQSETKKIMYRCCERYAKENGKNVESIQLILSLNIEDNEMGEYTVDESEPNKYIICEDYSPKKQLGILDVLNVKIDFLGYSKLAPPFIFKSLVRYSQEKSINLERVMIMCVPSKNEKNKPDILLALYNGMEYVETITFSDLFREEDAEMPI